MSSVIGLLFGNDGSDILQGLTFQRSMAALPFAGRYRLLDFALSSMVNSGLRTIGLVTPPHNRAMLDHLGAGKDWFLDRKAGGLFILPGAMPELPDGGGTFRLKDLRLNVEYLQKDFAENVIISGCNHIFNMDYREALAFQEKQRADITLIVKKGPDVFQRGERDSLVLASDGGVIALRQEASQGEDASLGEEASPARPSEAYFIDMLIIRRRLLLEMIAEEGPEIPDLLTAIEAGLGRLRVFAFPFTGYFGTINSVEDYLARSMELLNPDVRKEVLTGQNRIHTKIVDNPPTKHGARAKVANSLISSGCTIEGEVYNSVLSRGVIVEPGAVVRNCVIMQKSSIAAGALLEYVILDKFVKVHAGKVLKGSRNAPFVALKGSLV
ncbi:Glucose-1-phosphate adenylyltransferase, GlgD subunit [Acididesulfobacillus acetoxydans]|uniref:Glucose-1-phosphate adenylyltransferase n=1 Tax=Acididesulfobacillus acetoxydans TaxID=1561005 RepID=A0A8S0WHL3_9FIRM|nr:glucose-1-phosphate adenylyltransferase subunit GlgD [Acididesulfobacillus acetoxydans]CAA7602782.1 Glucose-1-phosphate adenylyltransferase, GlgD subunit [Acididesulfobacillus acetoxydans]CEJ06361.1 Glucose-1-phosphate adenylyltransferase [Acididesulfobacillus acetoxydans]